MGMFNDTWLKQLMGTAQASGAVDDNEDLRPSLDPPVPRPCLAGGEPVLVAWASQMGAAEALARETVACLEAADVPVHCVGFQALRLSQLESSLTALFVVSTTYDGDPPDMAEAFSREVMARSAQLSHLRYGLLALGDSGYASFCGFGRKLHAWLQASGAQACFEPIEVDDDDERTLCRWRQQIDSLLTAATAAPARPMALPGRECPDQV